MPPPAPPRSRRRGAPAASQLFNVFIYKSSVEVRVGISFERDADTSSHAANAYDGAVVRALHPYGIAVRAHEPSGP